MYIITIFCVLQITPEEAAKKMKMNESVDEADAVAEDEEQVIEVPCEVEVEEVVEREVIKEVMEERRVPQVRALYPYKGQDMKVNKGEVSHKGQITRSLVKVRSPLLYQNIVRYIWPLLEDCVLITFVYAFYLSFVWKHRRVCFRKRLKKNILIYEAFDRRIVSGNSTIEHTCSRLLL